METGRTDFRGRPIYKITCADCGREAEVPFKPDGVRDVYCKDCYAKRKPRYNRY